MSFYIFIANDIYVIFRFNALIIVRKRQKITFYTVVKPSLFATTNVFAFPFQDVGCSALEFNINALSVEGFHRCLFTLFFTSSLNMERSSSQAVDSKFDVHKLLLVIVFKVSNEDAVHWLNHNDKELQLHKQTR